MSKLHAPYRPKSIAETQDSVLTFDQAADANHWNSLSISQLFGSPPTSASLALADTALAAGAATSPLAASRAAFISGASATSLAATLRRRRQRQDPHNERRRFGDPAGAGLEGHF